MKQLLILLVACTLGMSHFSFSQEPIYNWGAPSTNEDLDKKVDQVLSLNDKGFVILRKFTDQMFVNRYSIESYDTNLSLIETNPIDFNLGVMGDSYFIEDIKVAGNKVYAFVSHWLKSAGKHTLTLHELNLDGTLTKLSDLDVIVAKKMGNRGVYSISISADGSKLAVLSEQPFVKKTNEKIKLSCFSLSDQKLLWTQEKELEWPSKRAANNYINVNDRGEVMLFKKFWEKPAWKYELYVGSKSAWNSYSDLDLSEKEVVDFKCTADATGNLIMFGLYTLKPSAFERNIHGTCFYSIGADLELQSAQVKSVDSELLTYFVGEKRANSGKGAISDLAIKDILNRDDGDLMVLLEQQKEDKKPVVGSSPIQYTYEFIYGDFVTLNLSTKGELIWWQAFSKNQQLVTNNEKDEYGSYVYYLKNDRLHILWNNTELSVPSIPPAFWKEPDGTKYVKNKSFNDKTMYATFLEVIEPDGALAYENRTFGLPLFNLHAGAVFEMSMNTNFSFEVNNDLVIMASMHNGGKRYRFGFVGL